MKNLTLLLLFLTATASLAQKNKPAAGPVAITIPFAPDKWDFAPGKVEFIDYKGVKAVRLNETSGTMAYKDLTFKNGTIECDVEVNRAQPFPTISFRWQNEGETEHVYLRTGTANRKKAFDAVQYAAIIGGVNLWDLEHEYQAYAEIKINSWNHVKLVVSGKQMRVYVNDMSTPCLAIPNLEGNTSEGKIALTTGFPGQAVFANLVVKPNETEGLAPLPAPDLTLHDTRYIRKWQVSKTDSLPAGRELIVAMLPKPDAQWETIEAEYRSLVNLSRKFGNNPFGKRKYVWLRAKIKADAAQTQTLKLGFSDEVWVFLNQQLTYVDKCIYFYPNMRKSPNGRISLDNSSFPLQLRQGDNELVIGVANDFFGWAIIARLENLDGVEVVDP